MEASGLSRATQRQLLAAGAAIVLLTVLFYSNSFRVPLFFDDSVHIKTNPTIRDFSRMVSGLTRTNRPLALFLNWINFQVGGLKPFGYHLVNLAIHLANCVLIYLLLVFTPKNTGTQREIETLRVKAAFAAAIFFALHPMHTMAVTYVIQGRMVGTATLGVLLSILLYRRAVVRDRPHLFILAFLAFLFGLGGKESAGMAPLLCLVYDRLFLAGREYGFRRARIAYHLAGFAVVLFAGVLVLFYHQKTETTGFATRETTPLGYLFTQFGVIVTYLRLLVFPATLKIHHQITDARGLFYPETLVPLAFLLIVAGFFLWLGKRDRRFAFGILWFFLALAPTSSIIPIVDRIFEYRAYLPSLGFCFIIAATLEQVKMTKRGWVGVLVVIPLLWGVRTYDRNLDWQDPWEMYILEARTYSPNHYRALTLAMNTLADAGRNPEALIVAKKLLKVKPIFQDARLMLGRDALRRKDYEEAEAHFLLALKGKKERLKHVTYSWLGLLETQRGNTRAAEQYFKNSLKREKSYLFAIKYLGKLAQGRGDTGEAEEWYLKAFSLFPDNPNIALTLAGTLVANNKPQRAIEVYKKTLRWNRKNTRILNELGVLLYRAGRPRDALVYLRKAARLKPHNPRFTENLANCLFAAGDYREAQKVYLRFIEMEPRHSGMARAFLGRSLLHLGRVDEGLARLAESCKRPDGDVEACFELGLFHTHFKRYQKAAAAYKDFLSKGGEPHRGYYNLGMLYLDKLGDPKRGLDYLSRSLKAKPDQEFASTIRERLSQKGR